jgi:hypothetical protein
VRPLKIVLGAAGVAVFLALYGLAPAIAVAAGPGPASVAATRTLPAAPLPKKPPVFDVQLWPEVAGSGIVVNATVTTGTPLPVLIRMPLPAGATVDWVGEILGNTSAEDIRSDYRLVDSGRMLEMVLTTSRTAQYEATFVQPVRNGDLLVSTLEWTQSTPASSVRFAVKATSAIGDVSVQPSPAHAPQFNESGDRLYVLEARSLKTGEKTTVTATYRAGGNTTGSTTTPTSQPSAVLVVLLALLGVSVAALLMAVRRQASLRRRG